MPLTDASTHASFTDFVRDRSDRLHDVAWLVTRNADDARDAVQDALAGLYRHWSRLPAGDEFEAYVHRTVVNACLSVIRRRPRSLPVAEPAGLRAAPVSPDGVDALAASDEVWRLCGQLTPVQRTAVVLRFYEDLSFAEIAKTLVCREATARSHVHRAMVRLRARLTQGKVMDDLGRTFREGLRDAAANKPALGPIDLDAVTARSVDAVRRRRPARWLAAAAAAVLVAAIGVGAYVLNGRGVVPAIPAAPSSPVATDVPSVTTCKITDVGTALHPNRVSVRVFEDGSIGGLAKVTSLYLRAHDFTVLEYGTTTDPVPGTTIRGAAADSPEVRLVQLFFPGSVAQGDGRADHSVDVLVHTLITQAGPTDAGVPVSGPVCLPQIIGNGGQVSVEVRVRNDTNLALDDTKVISLEDDEVSFGRLTSGAVSKYRIVERAYPNAWFSISFASTPRSSIYPQDADYKSPKDSDLLAPGRYTYVINLDEQGRLGLRLEVDR